ncbi:MAG TPA: PilN domain-containing protein [Stellaceae bacterium]|nr:PilN domain-containing protein [Stellaceae bacterium]
MMRDFWDWWLGQLLELLPRRLRRTGESAGDALVIAPIGPLGDVDGVTASLRRGGREAPLGRYPLGGSGFAGLPRASGKPAVLRLRDTDVLQKTVSLPLAAERELRQVLAFEMDRETPFTTEELYWDYRVEAVDRQSGRLSVRLTLLPKARLAPLLAALKGAGIAPRRAEITGAAGRACHLPLDGNDGRLEEPSRRFLYAAAACCAVLGLAVVVTPFIRQSLALAAVDRRVAAGKSAAAEAEKLRRDIDRLSGNVDLIERERDKAGHPLEVLAAATRVLPDDTYLSEIALRHRKVTLSGRSAAAARLIGPLSASGEFGNPAFAAPVTRLEALHAEVFTITAEVRP